MARSDIATVAMNGCVSFLRPCTGATLVGGAVSAPLQAEALACACADSRTCRPPRRDCTKLPRLLIVLEKNLPWKAMKRDFAKTRPNLLVRLQGVKTPADAVCRPMCPLHALMSSAGLLRSPELFPEKYGSRAVTFPSPPLLSRQEP